MNIGLDEIADYISKFVDYIDNFTVNCREKEFAIQKLEEAVFWIIYLNEDSND